MDRGFKFRTRRETRYAFGGHFDIAPATWIPHAPRLTMRDAERSESRNGHPVSPHQAGLNPLYECIQRTRSLRPREARIRSDLPYKIFFVHSVREFYQSGTADVNRHYQFVTPCLRPAGDVLADSAVIFNCVQARGGRAVAAAPATSGGVFSSS